MKMTKKESLKKGLRLIEIKFGKRKEDGIRKWFCITCSKYLGTDRTKIPISSHLLGTYCGKKCWEKAKKQFLKVLSSV